MIIRFAYVGTKSDELVVVDTDNKNFVYWTNIKVEDSVTIVNVKTRKDIQKILQEMRNDGFSLKIGD